MVAYIVTTTILRSCLLVPTFFTFVKQPKKITHDSLNAYTYNLLLRCRRDNDDDDNEDKDDGGDWYQRSASA